MSDENKETKNSIFDFEEINSWHVLAATVVLTALTIAPEEIQWNLLDLTTMSAVMFGLIELGYLIIGLTDLPSNRGDKKLTFGPVKNTTLLIISMAIIPIVAITIFGRKMMISS
ncbi:MAG: hypothetical protein MHMPM18_002804 [Marteilia pararefringens]